jgi:hypothetical protein
MATRSSAIENPADNHIGDVVPIDLDAMMRRDDGPTALRWPVSTAEMRVLQTAWRGAYLSFVVGLPPGLDQDSALLGYASIITRTIPLAEAAQTLEHADRQGMSLIGGPAEIDYLRGLLPDDEIPDGPVDELDSINAARHPLVRSVLSTRHLASIWKMPLHFAAPTGKAVAHNQLLFDMTRREGQRMVFHDAGSLLNRCRRLHTADPSEDDVELLAQRLTDCLVQSSGIVEPYYSRLARLVKVKLRRILRQTIADVLIMRQATLPSILWGNSGGQYAARAMAIEVLRRGGETRFFTHAGTTAMVHLTDSVALGEFAVSSTFVVETDTLAEQHELDEARRLIAPIREMEVVGGEGNKKILTLPLKSRRRGRERPRVVYVSAPSRGYTRHGLKAMPEVLYLDWQLRLAEYLARLPIDLVCKPHPGGYFGGRRHPVENVAPTDYGRFEDLIEEADIFVFDSCTTTTIWEALCTDRPVVYFDLDLFRLHQVVAPLFDRRCRVVRVLSDEFNRPVLEPSQVDAAMFDNGPVDPSGFQRLLVGAAA